MFFLLSSCYLHSTTDWNPISFPNYSWILTLLDINNNNNNNNNNKQDNVYGAVIMTQSHCESSPGLRDECRTAPDGCWPLDQADVLEPLVLGYHIHRYHLLLLSLKADTLFTVPQREECWVTYPDGLPARKQSPIQVVTRPSVDWLLWSKPTLTFFSGPATWPLLPV